MKVIFRFVCFMILVISSIPALAEENTGKLQGGQFGFEFFVPQSPALAENGFVADILRGYGIGASYNITDNITVEPSIMYMHFYKKDSGNDEETDDMVGTSLGLFYYSSVSNGLYMYAGPRFSYFYSKGKDEDSSGSYDEEEEFMYEINAVFGLKYMFNNNIGVFADFGIGYSAGEGNRKSYDSAGTLTSESDNSNDYIKAASSLLGVVFYF